MDGTEYVGSFQEGVRSGWGIMSNANGDEYIGEEGMNEYDETYL